MKKRRFSCHPFLLPLIVIFVAGLHQNTLADSQIVSPSTGFSAEDLLSSTTPEAWSTFDTSMAIYKKPDGLTLVDPITGSELFDLGKPDAYISQYLMQGIWAGFITPDPSYQSLWVGFTITGNADDRIYQVDLNNNWAHRATLTGNFDLEFHNGNAYVSANPGADQSPFEPLNKIYQLDTSGSNNHDVVADLGGYSAGLGIDSAGNIYCGTNNLGSADNKMYRFSNAQIASAIGPGSISLAEAEILFDITGVLYDVDLDDADHLVFDCKADSSTSVATVWCEGAGENGEDVFADIASGTGSSPCLTMIDVEGDILTPTGKLFVTNSGQKGIAEISADTIPGDANLDGYVDDIDATILATNWHTAAAATWSQGDFDDSGTVDQADAAIMAANWLKSTLDMLTQSSAAAASVPEPTGLVLLLAGVFCAAAISFVQKRPWQTVTALLHFVNSGRLFARDKRPR